MLSHWPLDDDSLVRLGGGGGGGGGSGSSSSSSTAGGMYTLTRRPAHASAAAEWDRQRPFITQLYQDEERKLEEVMEIMVKEHGFDATKRMYKKKISEWSLDKKLKEDDVLQILRICASRSRDVLPVAFFVRGKRVHDLRLRRYINRNPRVLRRFNTGAIPADESIKAVTYQNHVLVNNWVAQGSDGRANSLEQLLWSLRRYVQGCFGQETWTFDKVGCWSSNSTPRHDLELHDTWHLPFVDVINGLMNRDDAKTMGRALNRYFDRLATLVKAHPPFFIAALVGMLFRLQQHQQHKIQKILLRHVYELCLIYHGEEHGLTQVIGHLNYLTVVFEGDIFWYEQPLNLLVSSFETQTGEENAITVCLMTIYMAVALMNGSWSSSWVRKMAHHAHIITRGVPNDVADIVSPGSELTDTNSDSYVLDYLMDDRLPPAARQILTATRYELAPGSGDAYWLGPSWSLNAMALAKRHYKFHLSLFSPKLFPLIINYFTILNDALGLKATTKYQEQDEKEFPVIYEVVD